MSPLVWDLGHIARVRGSLALSARRRHCEPLRPDLAMSTTPSRPRAATGASSRTCACAEALEYLEAVRERALAVLEACDFADPSDRLNHEAFVWQMLIQHEHQHNETMLQTLMLAEPGTYSPRRRELPGADQPAIGSAAMIRIAGGPFVHGRRPVGASFTYDNERPAARGLPAAVRHRPCSR